MIKNKNIDRKKVVKYYPVMEFFSSGIIESTGTQISADGGGAIFAEISSLAVVGMQIAAVDDAISALRLPPEGLDWNKDVDYRPIYCSTSNDADTPVWKFFYKSQADATILTAPTTASFEITDTANGVQYSINEPTYHTIAAGTIEADKKHVFIVTCSNLGSASTNELHLLGLEFCGYPNCTGE